MAYCTSCALLWISSLRIKLNLWASTVFTLSSKQLAISLTDLPSASIFRISRSRLVSVPKRGWRAGPRFWSPILPVWTIKAVVRRHFARTIPYLVEQNLSRLTTQWEESINVPLFGVEKEAKRRLDELMATVERLVE